MKLPRDITGTQLAGLLSKFGYEIDRQKGSHIRLTTHLSGEHHITIPAHDPLKVGMLSAILFDVSSHLNISREKLIQELL
jgi:predicted RNA binding protein YcfA (HicA-like mRNA interferase family)